MATLTEDNSLTLDNTPKLHEIDRIERHGSTVKIIDGCAGDWEGIAIRLHYDGEVIQQMLKDSQNITKRACRQVFTDWLKGKKGLRTPRTWKTVIDVLEESGLGQLAQDLRDIIHIPLSTLTISSFDAPKKRKKSFPMLTNTVGMSEEEFERLKTRLLHESVETVEKFARTFSNFFQSLSSRNTKVKTIVAEMRAFGAFSPIYEQQPLLKDELKTLTSATADMDDVKLSLHDYCSFFSYKLLTHLVTQLGTPNDKKELQDYDNYFHEYAKRRIFECPSEISDINETKANLMMKLDDQYNDCSLNKLRLLEADLCKTLNITNLKLCHITSGCLQLTFQLPTFVQEKVFPVTQSQEKKLAELHILSLTCGTYRFSTSESQAQGTPKKHRRLTDSLSQTKGTPGTPKKSHRGIESHRGSPGTPKEHLRTSVLQSQGKGTPGTPKRYHRTAELQSLRVRTPGNSPKRSRSQTSQGEDIDTPTKQRRTRMPQSQPGGLDTKLNLEKDHSKVSSYLKRLDKYQIRRIGSSLGVDYEALIKMRLCPEDMVTAWLRREGQVLGVSGEPTWKRLMKALKSANQETIAKEIERENSTKRQ